MLFDSSSKVNAIHPIFAKKLSLPIKPRNVGAQKIDGIMLDIVGMVFAAFSVTNKANQVRFFEKTFLVANIGPKVIFEMFFLTLSSADIDFLSRELWWKTYTTKKALQTTRRIELVGKKKFAAVMLNPESGIFVVHVASLSFVTSPSSSPLELDIHPFCRP